MKCNSVQEHCNDICEMYTTEFLKRHQNRSSVLKRVKNFIQHSKLNNFLNTFWGIADIKHVHEHEFGAAHRAQHFTVNLRTLMDHCVVHFYKRFFFTLMPVVTFGALSNFQCKPLFCNVAVF